MKPNTGDLTRQQSASIINSLAELIHSNSREKGFYAFEVDRSIPTKLLLITSEVIEAMDVIRKEFPSYYEATHSEYVRDERYQGHFAEELADIVIRVFDLAGFCDVKIGDEIIKKIKANLKREYRNGDRNF